MRPGDLSRCDLVIVADVGRGIAAPMLELDREAHPELLDVKRRAAPVDSNPFADPTGLFSREITVMIHRPSLPDLLHFKRRAAPVNSNPFADPTGLFSREITVMIHRPSLPDPPKPAIRSS